MSDSHGHDAHAAPAAKPSGILLSWLNIALGQEAIHMAARWSPWRMNPAMGIALIAIWLGSCWVGGALVLTGLRRMAGK